MDCESYKKNVMAYSDSMLVEQHEIVSDLVDTCWDNAMDCCGEESEHWLDQYNEAKEQVKILENEMSYRHINF